MSKELYPELGSDISLKAIKAIEDRQRFVDFFSPFYGLLCADEIVYYLECGEEVLLPIATKDARPSNAGQT